MKTKSKFSAYVLRSSTSVLLFSFMIVALCPAIHLPEQPRKASHPQDNASFGVSRSLSFADRVAYQTAIEDVYWRHRIWPETNSGPKPPLDKVMSQADIEKKVTEYLRNSQALEDYWRKPIAADQLQVEMERMASHTKQPKVLQELFAALGNDPFVIAECLARPVLAERLVREQSDAANGRDGSPSRPLPLARPRRSEQALVAPYQRNYQLPVIASPSGGCTDDTWTPTTLTTAPVGRNLHTAVWTGSEMIVWGGQDQSINDVNTGGKYNPSTDSWTPTTTTNAPAPRERHTAVWSGTEMIVWGGTNSNLNTGGRYNPSTDSWTATNSITAPAGRQDHTAVWTGSEMIVWGGGNNSGNLNSGGRYNPSTDTWTATSMTNVPSARGAHAAVWTDSEMIVWGGAPLNNTGGRYNPSTDSWTPTTTTNAPVPRDFIYQNRQVAVWTGSEMIIWGGFNSNGFGLNTGGKYNPVTDSWTATSLINVPSARYEHTAVWTDNEMIVWGGYNGNQLNTGGRYNPSTDSWTATSIIDAPTARAIHTAVWTGSEMIVWGGGSNLGHLNTGGRYCAAGGPSPTPTPTASPSPTGTATATATATATPTATVRPTPTPRIGPTPRVRPTPAPRP